METNYLYIKNNPDTTQLLIELKQKVWRGLMLCQKYFIFLYFIEIIQWYLWADRHIVLKKSLDQETLD